MRLVPVSLVRRIRLFFIPERLFVFSFATIILAGTVLLAQPFAVHGNPLSFVDALFTATSATCVTGLIVVDTATRFTVYGQVVILFLIQLGGLGIMTFSVAFFYVMARRLSIGNKGLLEASFSQMPMQGMRGLLRTIFSATFIIEGIGALILSARFAQDMPLGKAVYFGVFHAVSAFCNAGFALFSDSLLAYQNDFVVIFTIALLIILGGIGFVVLYELHTHRVKFEKLTLNTRVVLVTTLSLIVFGFVLILLFEWGNTLQQFSLPQKILHAFFQSVTTRTAGFNSLDIGHLSNATLFIMIVLMYIGASPSSTGGGIKTTTLATILAFSRSRFKNQEHSEMFYRRLSGSAVSKAVTIVIFSSLTVILFTTLLLFTELSGHSHQASRGMFLELIFEVTSAFATVGLSTGITPHLTQTGRVLITLVMFIGRLGPLTTALAIGKKEPQKFKYAKEEILIG